MTRVNETHNVQRRSWEASANREGTDFPLQNLPFGVFSQAGGRRRFGIAIGDAILDVGAALDLRLLKADAAKAAEAASTGELNQLFACGPEMLRELRRQVALLLDADSVEGIVACSRASTLLTRQIDSTMHLPTKVNNYTDFFAGIHHARASGAIARPDRPLLPNYKWVPIAYNGRASSVRVSGEPIRRPSGQRILPGQTDPQFGPSLELDLELEIGFYVGSDNALGAPISIQEAEGQLVGLCLLNDWSARDIQRWEAQPLGPFLAKSFSTSVSPWVITANALAPFRYRMEPRPEGDPQPLPHLLDEADQAMGAFDIRLAASLQTARMREEGQSSVEIIRSNARHLYWTLGQMITHQSSNGCNLEAGDLTGTGTISGPSRQELSSLLEVSKGGKEHIALPNGETRTFLEDGDEVTLTARCERKGFASIGFGSCSGVISA